MSPERMLLALSVWLYSATYLHTKIHDAYIDIRMHDRCAAEQRSIGGLFGPGRLVKPFDCGILTPRDLCYAY